MPNGFSMRDEMNKNKAKEAWDRYYKTGNLKDKEEAKELDKLSNSSDSSEDGESNYSGDDSGWGFTH